MTVNTSPSHPMSTYKKTYSVLLKRTQELGSIVFDIIMGKLGSVYSNI